MIYFVKSMVKEDCKGQTTKNTDFLGAVYIANKEEEFKKLAAENVDFLLLGYKAYYHDIFADFINKINEKDYKDLFSFFLLRMSGGFPEFCPMTWPLDYDEIFKEFLLRFIRGYEREYFDFRYKIAARKYSFLVTPFISRLKGGKECYRKLSMEFLEKLDGCPEISREFLYDLQGAYYSEVYAEFTKKLRRGNYYKEISTEFLNKLSEFIIAEQSGFDSNLTEVPYEQELHHEQCRKRDMTVGRSDIKNFPRHLQSYVKLIADFLAIQALLYLVEYIE